MSTLELEEELLDSGELNDAEDDPEPGAELEAEQPRDYAVVLGGETYQIAPPSTDTVLRILNRIGILAMSAEQLAAKVVKDPSWRAVLFGLLGAMNRDQLVRMGAVVFQFEDEGKGRKELDALGDDLRVTPIIRALFFNVEQSDDLMEALSAFFEGVAGALGAAGNLLASLNLMPGTPPVSTDDTGSSTSAES